MNGLFEAETSEQVKYVDMLDKKRNTALYCACKNGNYEVAEALINYGVKIMYQPKKYIPDPRWLPNEWSSYYSKTPIQRQPNMDISILLCFWFLKVRT